MKFLLTEINSRNFDKKQYSRKIVSLRSVTSYFYLILINHFLMESKVHCAETFDISFIEDSMGSLKLNKDCKESFNDEHENLNIKDLTQKNSDENLKESESLLSLDPFPSDNETEGVLKEFNVLESIIISTILRLDLIIEETIPKLLKNHDEMIGILTKIKVNINKTKEKVFENDLSFFEKILQFFWKRPAEQVPSFLKNIEQFYEDKKNFYGVICLTINNMKDKAIQLCSELRVFGSKLQEMKSSGSFCDLSNVYEDFAKSKFDKSSELFLNEIEEFEVPFDEDKNSGDLILFILSKFQTLPLKEFEENEEVNKKISLLSEIK